MDQLGILFKLKDLLNPTCGKQVLSGLIRHPLIRAYLSDPENLQKLINKFGNDHRQWTLLNICKYAADVDAEIPSSQKVISLTETVVERRSSSLNQVNLVSITSLNEIYPVAQAIADKGKMNLWQEVFEKVNLSANPFPDEKGILGTVFSIVFELTENKKDFFCGLLNYSIKNSGQKHLAQLLILNETIFESLTKSFGPVFSNLPLEKFVSLIRAMQFFDEEKSIQVLCKKYVETFPFDGILQRNITDGLSGDLSQLSNIKGYSTIYQLLGNEKEFKKISGKAQAALSAMGKKMGFIANFETINPKKELINRAEESHPNTIIKEVNRIRAIAKTDLESARYIADEFSKKIITSGDLVSLLFDQDLGFLLKPDQLAYLFFDLDLITQTSAILNKMLVFWPQSVPLLRIGANLAHDKGSHADAARLFSDLYFLDALTREEKIKLATSLEHLDRWEDAHEIRASINITNKTDLRDAFISAYHAGNHTVLEKLVAENHQWIGSQSLYSLVSGIAKNGNNQVIDIDDYFMEIKKLNPEDQKCILLVSDFFIKTGEFEKALRILDDLEELTSNSCSITNRRFDIHEAMGEREKGRLILADQIDINNSDQKSTEVYLGNLINIGGFKKASFLLVESLKKWELSPFLRKLSAKMLIEERKFLQAEKLLNPLLNTEVNDADCVFNYCLTFLKCRIADFPIGIQENKSIPDEIKTLLDFKYQNEDIFLDLLDAELDSEKRLEKYQLLLQQYSNGSNPESWRIYAGLGKTYFDLKQYDSAIVNLKRASITVPNNAMLLWLLVQCYINLRLWNEIDTLFNSEVNLDVWANILRLKKKLNQSEKIEWSHFLENQVQKKPDELLIKALLAQSYVEINKKFEAIELVKNIYEKLDVSNEYYLFWAQILADANEPKLAERLVEVFLSNKKSLDQKDYLACSFLYDQLLNPKKALAMVNHLGNLDLPLSVYKTKLLKENESSSQPLNAFNYENNSETNEGIDLSNLIVRIPELIIQLNNDPALAYLAMTFAELKEKNLDQAISTLYRGLVKLPANQEILSNLFYLLTFTGRNEELEKVIKANNDALLEIKSPNLICVLGEIALSNGEEVTCARYLSDAIKIAPMNPRVRALQARMITRNGNTSDALNIFNQTLYDFQKNENDYAAKNDAMIFSETGSKLWLADAALEMREYSAALEICRQEINNFGYFLPNSKIFLSALSALLEEEFKLHEIKVSTDLNEINDDIKEIYSTIINNCAKEFQNNREFNESLIKCQLFLGDDPEAFIKAEGFDSKENNINAKIYAIFKNKGQAAAEIAFNSLKANDAQNFFFAVLEKDSNPEKALQHLKKVENQAAPDARSNALLAIIEKNLGNFSDAYAAICLALEEKPDEYEWQIMAGDLSKTAGDLHASLSHYDKAQSLNIKQNLNKDIETLNLSIETEAAIPILEKQLLRNPDQEQRIQLGKIYFKFGNYRKAVNIFESAAQHNPMDARPYYWLSEISLRLKNPSKALEKIEKAITLNDSDIQMICTKARILKDLFGLDNALKYFDDEIGKSKDDFPKLFLYKSRLISEVKGNEAALRMLNSYANIQESPVLLIEKAKLESKFGNFNASELIAEKLLDHNELKWEALALLGSIAKERGEFDRAIDFYIKAIEFNPANDQNFINLADIYNDRKDFKRVMETLEDGIKTNPGSFILLYKTGLYYYQHGLYSQAEKRFKEAIKIEPDNKDSKEIMRLLKNAMTVEARSLTAQFIG